MNTKRYEIKDTISISVKNGILLVKIKNRKHQIWMSEKLYLVAFKRVKTFSENNTYFLLTSRNCSAKIHRLSLQTRDSRERLFIRKVVPYRPQPEGMCFAKQSLFQSSNTETKSNSTLKIKDRIIHRP